MNLRIAALGGAALALAAPAIVLAQKGTISGTAVVTATPIEGSDDLSYRGTLDVARGTKAYRGVKAKGLKVTGTASGGVIRLRIAGAAKFPVTTR